jgi:sphingomyelin phosphodiesterase
MLIWARLSVFLTLGLFARASLITTILDAIENAVDCGSCHALLTVLQGVAILGDSVFSDVLVGVCEAVKVRHISVNKTFITTKVDQPRRRTTTFVKDC